VLLTDPASQDGLKVIDLGAGHSSASETLCGHVLQALRQEALVNESIGAGYLDRHWPPAFEQSGEWPLSSLRQAFINGTHTRLIDPEQALRVKIAELVEAGDLGLASRKKTDGGFERVWFQEAVPRDEIAFEGDVYLLKKAAAERQREPSPAEPRDEATSVLDGTAQEPSQAGFSGVDVPAFRARRGAFSKSHRSPDRVAQCRSLESVRHARNSTTAHRG
jgi:hypothetical protein